jgi:hypothetical protein
LLYVALYIVVRSIIFCPKDAEMQAKRAEEAQSEKVMRRSASNKGTVSRLYTDISFTRVATVTASFHYLHSIVSHKHIPVYMHYR